MFHEGDLDPVLADLLSCPLAIILIEYLAIGRLSLSELRALARARRRATEAALRVLAAHQLVARCGVRGTWDARPEASARFELTDSGRQAARQLEELDVWVTIYQRYLYGPPEADA
ncbi:hypothetical protein [Amycolatopsis sp.]|uniref:hypothetical protein n=1 Tax=Amycolatopsis sp. TaxID=37632 RepID=UPI002B7499F6|nr:hypothetical protein [Amycolatopsis sp.]HVV11987.1 hypothetical protein [Amycolatopsis sp.]